MKASLYGTLLPESQADALELKTLRIQRFDTCLQCKKDLAAPDAASTKEGWQETQITGICEPCFDQITAFDEDA